MQSAPEIYVNPT